ncbi:MAG: SPOR domain-containing protein, partial [Candidatus Binatia bacterium]
MDEASADPARDGLEAAAVASDASVLGPVELAEAKLLMALHTRPGHILVVAEDASRADALFRRVVKDVAFYRCVTVDGRSLDPDAVVQALKGVQEKASTFRRLAIMQALVDEARAASLPIAVVVARADLADARSLESLRQNVECVRDASEVVRLVLLGGPRLMGTLRQPDARALATRIVATVSLPGPRSTQPGASEPIPHRRGRGWPTAIGLGVVAAAAVWMGLQWNDASRSIDTASAPVAATTGTDVVAPLPPESGAETAAPVAQVEEDVQPPPPAPVVAEDTAPIEPPPAEPPPPAASPSPVSPGLALQVGSFLRPQNAEALQRELGARYRDVYISIVERDGRSYHRVRVGPLP